MFEGFAIPDLVRVSRHTVVSALVIGVLGLAAAVLLRAPLVGLGFGLGIGMGILNFRLIVKSVAKVGAREDANHRRPLAANTMVRLATITVVALGLCFVSLPLGLGVMGGLAVFQFLLLANMARSMFKMGHGGIGGMLDAASASFSMQDDDGGDD
jgi:hypothetical protein